MSPPCSPLRQPSPGLEQTYQTQPSFSVWLTLSPASNPARYRHLLSSSRPASTMTVKPSDPQIPLPRHCPLDGQQHPRHRFRWGVPCWQHPPAPGPSLSLPPPLSLHTRPPKPRPLPLRLSGVGNKLKGGAINGASPCARRGRDLHHVALSLQSVTACIFLCLPNPPPVARLTLNTKMVVVLLSLLPVSNQLPNPLLPSALVHVQSGSSRSAAKNPNLAAAASPTPPKNQRLSELDDDDDDLMIY